MPVGEIAGELLVAVFKIIGRLFVEVIVEFLLKGAGYLVCRIFSKRIDPDGIMVMLVGLVFWVIITTGVFLLYEYIHVQLSIDSCLDSGGRFNDEQELCES